MRPQSPKSIKVLTLSMAFILSISCTKDTDLLADYVISDASQAQLFGNLVSDDYYFIANNKSIVLDVLSNDLIENPDKVKITEVSTPNNGTVTINEDKTLTYTIGTETPVKEESENTGTSSQEVTPEINQTAGEPETPEQNQIPEEKQSPEETVTPEQNQIPEEKQTPQKTETPEQNEIPQEKTPSKETDSTQEEEPINESITYTVETENEDGTTESQEGTVTITNDYGELKAFPSAKGFGKYTTGGRGGYVIHVTNLNDKGTGSLRAALYADGKRTVVFDVSGYIDLVNTISIRNPNITIAGQTAPGDGITIRGAEISIKASNVIIRYLRIRPGFNAAKGSECINIVAYKDNQTIDGVIIDHCSLSWSLDENLAFDADPRFKNNSIKNATFQNCLNAESLNNYAILMGRRLGRISLIRNLFANNNNRIPESTYGYTPESYEFNNNIIYNYSRPTVLGYGVNVDVIGNVYKAKDAPAVPNLQYHRNNIENPNGVASDGRVFQIDNLQIGQNPKGMTGSGFDRYNQSSKILADSPYEPIPSYKLEKTLLSDVGANIFDDPVDSRILRDYVNNEGIRSPKNESLIGGYPVLVKKKRPSNYDSDGDGMADNWELDNGLDPENPADGKADKNGDGYTNLEDFFHYLTLQ